MTAAVYTAPRDLDPIWLRPGDEVLMRPAAPDADVLWTPLWGEDVLAGDVQWLRVHAAVEELDDGSVLVELAEPGRASCYVPFGADELCRVRIPCEVTG